MPPAINVHLMVGVMAPPSLEPSLAQRALLHATTAGRAPGRPGTVRVPGREASGLVPASGPGAHTVLAMGSRRRAGALLGLVAGLVVLAVLVAVASAWSGFASGPGLPTVGSGLVPTVPLTEVRESAARHLATSEAHRLVAAYEAAGRPVDPAPLLTAFPRAVAGFHVALVPRGAGRFSVAVDGIELACITLTPDRPESRPGGPCAP